VEGMDVEIGGREGRHVGLILGKVRGR